MASSKASASWLSWTWPPVSLRATGRPSASTRAWILLVSPPRERPMPRSPDPPFYPSHHAGGHERRGVDHHDLAFEGGGNCGKQPVPNPGFSPTDKPLVAADTAREPPPTASQDESAKGYRATPAEHEPGAHRAASPTATD